MKSVMKKMIVLVTLVIIASSMMTGCGKTKGEARKEKAITGKWKEVDGSQTIEFFKNGTVSVVDKDEPSLPGDYRFIDDNQIRMNLALFGPITVEISSSLDEITLINPFGKVEKYRKFRQIDKAIKSNIAGNYTAITIMSDGKKYKSPYVSTWRKDGTGLNKFSGRWKIRDNELELHVSRDTTLVGGQITTDTLYREPPAVSLTKQRNAKVIKKLETGNILWANYSFTGDRSNMIKSRSLEIKEDGTFREIVLFRNVWRIKDGAVEITIIDKNQKKKQLKGKIEAGTIVFKDGETEIRFVKQDSFPVSSVGFLKSESTSQGKETSSLERVDTSEMIWVKCKNLSCGVEYEISKRECFKYIEEHADLTVMSPTAPPLVCKKCGEQSVYRAEKCGNPDCSLIFFRGAVPNDFADRCPKCGYSEREEQRKYRRSTISSSRISSSSETTDPSPARHSMRARRR